MGPQYQGSLVSRHDLNGTDDSSAEGDELDELTGSDEDESFALGGDSEEQVVNVDDESSSDADLDDDTEDGLSEDERTASDNEEESEQEESMGSIRKAVMKGNDGTEGHDSSATDDDSATEGDDNFSEEKGETDDSSSSSRDEAPVRLDDRAALRKMMAESQKSVIATISAATKADAAKGKAVKQQRSTFDALLNTRIRLQKSLIAVNSFSSSTAEKPNPSSEFSIQAAETAALKLWNQLDTLRQSLREDSSASKKRPFEATLSTPTSALWTHMQTHEAGTTPHRRAILSKWSTKLQPPTQLRPNLSGISSSTQTPLPALLDQHLSAQNTARLIGRSRIPRSCAPASLATSTSSSSSPTSKIYDDSDFYTLLLRDLVDRRMGDVNTKNSTTTILPRLDSIAAAADLKPPKRHRPNVDTKASKGRKMRYTVHEKLRDFMVRDDRTTWGEKQVKELFGGLLGVRTAGEDVLMDENGDDDDEEKREEEGLMLFRSGKN